MRDARSFLLAAAALVAALPVQAQVVLTASSWLAPTHALTMGYLGCTLIAMIISISEKPLQKERRRISIIASSRCVANANAIKPCHCSIRRSDDHGDE